jgi:hypothetical protein
MSGDFGHNSPEMKIKNNSGINCGGTSGSAAALLATVRQDFSFDDRCVKELREAMKTLEEYRTSEDYRFLHEVINRSLGFNVRYNRQTLPFWQFLAAVGDPRTVLILRTINETIVWTCRMTESSDCSDSTCYEQIMDCHQKIWSGVAKIREHIASIALARNRSMTITEDLAVWGNK